MYHVWNASNNQNLFSIQEMQSKELSMERKTQETIIAELASMTEILKQTTLKIHHSVQKQNKVWSTIACSFSRKVFY